MVQASMQVDAKSRKRIWEGTFETWKKCDGNVKRKIGCNRRAKNNRYWKSDI